MDWWGVTRTWSDRQQRVRNEKREKNVKKNVNSRLCFLTEQCFTEMCWMAAFADMLLFHCLSQAGPEVVPGDLAVIRRMKEIKMSE